MVIIYCPMQGEIVLEKNSFFAIVVAIAFASLWLA